MTGVDGLLESRIFGGMLGVPAMLAGSFSPSIVSAWKRYRHEVSGAND